MDKMWKVVYQSRDSMGNWNMVVDRYTVLGELLMDHVKLLRAQPNIFRNVRIYESILDWKEIDV